MAEVLASHQAELPSNGKLNEEVKNSKDENHPSKDSPKSNNSEDDKDGEVLNENGEEKGFVREPSTPMPVCRPARERKSVDRFIASADRDKVKEFKIEKGHGTELRDIPNVAYKLSKRTGADESVQQLHKLLFAKRAKNHITKQNILQFSGFVWRENKEKEKAKVKERFEKCFKDGLHQVSDLLDLKLPKSGKKEDYVTKLLEFLESPRKLTDKLLEEKEQKLKEKKKLKKSKKRSRKGTPAKTPGKRQRSIGSAEKPSKEDVKGEDEDMEEAEDMGEQSEEDETKKSSEESEDIENEVKPKRSRRGLSKKSKSSVQKIDSSEDLEDEVVNDSAMKQENDEGDSSSDSDDEDYGSRAKKRRARKQAKKSLKKEANGSNLEDLDMDDSQDNKALKNGSKIEKEDAQAKPLKKPKNDSISSEPEDKERVSTHNSPVKQEKLKTSTKNETASSKVSSRRKEGVDQEVKAKTPTGKSKDKTSESKASGKVKGKLEEEEIKVVPSPSEEELRASICEILKEADFNTVTFANVVEQLETRCKANLADMKSRVKSLIREEISKLAEAAEDEDGEDEQEVAAEEKSV